MNRYNPHTLTTSTVERTENCFTLPLNIVMIANHPMCRLKKKPFSRRDPPPPPHNHRGIGETGFGDSRAGRRSLLVLHGHRIHSRACRDDNLSGEEPLSQCTPLDDDYGRGATSRRRCLRFAISHSTEDDFSRSETHREPASQTSGLWKVV